MKKVRILLYFILCLVCINPINAFDISTTYSDKIVIQGLHISQEMLGRNLELDLAMNFVVARNYSLHRDNLTIYFSPYETINSLPIRIANITICKGSVSSMNYDENFADCGGKTEVYQQKRRERREIYILDGNLYSDEFFEYEFTFKPEDNQYYFIRLVGVYPNYVKKQGDLYSVALRYPDNKFNNVWNYFIFPSKDSIPQFIPNNLKSIKEQIYEDNGNYFSKWVFEFDGILNTVIFYKDQEELERNKLHLVLFGAGLGLLTALLFFIIDMIFGGYFRKVLRNLKNRYKFIKEARSKLIRKTSKQKNKGFFGKFISTVRSNPAKAKELAVGAVAGLFVGLPIGLLFKQLPTDDIKFNIIISIGVLIIFILLYVFGSFIVSILFSKKYKFYFYTSALSGMWSSATVAFLIKLGGNNPISIIYTISMVILYFILAYNHLKANRT